MLLAYTMTLWTGRLEQNEWVESYGYCQPQLALYLQVTLALKGDQPAAVHGTLGNAVMRENGSINRNNCAVFIKP